MVSYEVQVIKRFSTPVESFENRVGVNIPGDRQDRYLDLLYQKVEETQCSGFAHAAHERRNFMPSGRELAVGADILTRMI